MLTLEFALALKIMKKIAIIAVVVLGLGSCTQKLCPTYAEVEVENTPEIEATV